MPIPRPEGYDCFACGRPSPAGLGMTFFAEGDRVVSELALDAHLAGWRAMAHGGIVATLLDEVMAWAILYFKGSFCVTREIRVRYRSPVPVGAPIVVKGEIEEDPRRFACRAHGVVEDAKGMVLAEGHGDFALLRGEQLELLPEHLRERAERFAAAIRAAKQ